MTFAGGDFPYTKYVRWDWELEPIGAVSPAFRDRENELRISDTRLMAECRRCF